MFICDARNILQLKVFALWVAGLRQDSQDHLDFILLASDIHQDAVFHWDAISNPAYKLHKTEFLQSCGIDSVHNMLFQ